MDLKTYLSPLSADAREAFAGRCNTSRGHLQNVMYDLRPCSPELAVLIERESKGEVTRRELRADWRAIWPELDPRTVPRAPATHSAAKAG